MTFRYDNLLGHLACEFPPRPRCINQRPASWTFSKAHILLLVLVCKFLTSGNCYSQTVTLGPNSPDRTLFSRTADSIVNGGTIESSFLESFDSGSFNQEFNESNSDGTAISSASQNTFLSANSDSLTFNGSASGSITFDSADPANAQSISTIEFSLSAPTQFTLTATVVGEEGSVFLATTNSSEVSYAFGGGESGTVSGILPSGTYFLNMVMNLSSNDGSIEGTEIGSTSVNLNVNAVPEPSTYLLFFGGLGSLIIFARRRFEG